MRKDYQDSGLLKKWKGFTLMELLIVIAVLMVLMVVLLTVIDPREKLAQTRDVGRINALVQLGHSVSAYYLAKGSIFPVEGTWEQDIVSTGQPNRFPAGVKYIINSITPCTTNVQPATNPTYCYDVDVILNNALVYSRMESESRRSRCPSTNYAYYVYSTADGRGGIVCSDNDPLPWAKGTMGYVN